MCVWIYIFVSLLSLFRNEKYFHYLLGMWGLVYSLEFKIMLIFILRDIEWYYCICSIAWLQNMEHFSSQKKRKEINLLIYFNHYSQYFLYSVLDGTVVKGKQIFFSLSFSVASLVSSSLAITRYFANYLFLSFFLSFSPLLVLRNKWSTLMNSLNTNLHWCGRPSD